MSTNPFFADAAAKAACDAVAALCNSGFIKVYTGTQPADSNTAISGNTLLGTFSFGSTAFAASSASGTAPTRAATANANSISDVTAGNTGTATWFRALKTDGTTAVFDGTCGLSSADMIMTDVTITSGEDMGVVSLALSVPE